MLEAVSTSEMSVNSYETARSTSQKSHLHTRRRKNLKSLFKIRSVFYNELLIEAADLRGNGVSISPQCPYSHFEEKYDRRHSIQ
jgi:hypothetical protein